MATIAALVLAAGKGTRMHSEKPKVLQTLLGEPLLASVYRALRPHVGQDCFTVVGYGASAVQAAFPNEHFILQEEQLGTGHAVAIALPALAAYDRILIVNGDAPLLTEGLIAEFLQRAEGYDLAFATAKLSDPAAYGRVVRKGSELLAIVEAKDYDTAAYGPPSGEINIGLYVLSRKLAQTLLPTLERNEKSGEYYLTDLVAKALACGKRVEGLSLGSDPRLLGVNSPEELVALETYLQEEIVNSWLAQGVLIHAPKLARISPTVVLEPGAEISGPCELMGNTHIAASARVEAFCVLLDAIVLPHACVRSFSHVEKARIGEGAIVGPYARLRPSAHVDTNAHVGNFVEMKNAHLGVGAKANHLTYLGDAEIGAGTNIGAGTITCNYDGKKKHKTSIGSKAFIGSNTALVAPVEVGDGALIGAGSTITHNVPDGALAVARGRQKNYDERFRLRSTEAEKTNPS